MALDKEVADFLGKCLCETNVGSLFVGPENTTEKDMLYELLRNQFAIMQVLAAMNGMNTNAKAYRELFND